MKTFYVYVRKPKTEADAEICSHCKGTGKIWKDSIILATWMIEELEEMARAAELYDVIWKPDSLGINKAGQLIEPLRRGLKILQDNPRKFKKMDKPIGWAKYAQFVEWVKDYLEAAETDLDADIEVTDKREP